MSEKPKTWGNRLLWLVLLGLLAMGVVTAVVSWKHTLAGLVIAMGIASIITLPCVGFYWIRTGSLREACRETWELWANVAGEVFSQIA